MSTNTRKNLLAGLKERDKTSTADPGINRLSNTLRKAATPLSKEKLYDLPVMDILPNPFQYRTEESLNHSDLKNLAQSISEHGQRTPIQVRRKDDKYILIAGWRRLTAIKLYAKSITTIKATVDDEMTDQTHKILTIIENEQRSDFNLLEKAVAYFDLIKNEGFSQNDVAELVGISKNRLSQVLRLAHLPIDLQHQVNAAFQQGLSGSHAEEIAVAYSQLEWDSESKNSWFIDCLNRAVNEEWSIVDLRHYIQISKKGEKPEESDVDGSKSKKPLKKWTIEGGPWKKFEVSTRNKVTLEFQLPEECEYNDSKAIAQFIKNEVLKNIK